MTDWLAQHFDSILVAAVSAGSAAVGVMQWVYAGITRRFDALDKRLDACDDDIEAVDDEVTQMRVRVSRQEEQVDTLNAHMERLRSQSSAEHKELWQAVSALPTKSDMENMQNQLKEIRQLLINGRHHQNGS